MTTNLFDVSGRIVVVTGGLGQLGRQFSLTLAERGAKVAIFDFKTNPDIIDERFGAHKSDPNLMFLSVDLTNRSSIEEGLAEVQATWGVPFGLINNAALDSPPNAPTEETGPFETYPESSWDKVMAANAKGVFQACQVVGGAMAKSGRGSIINISSTYGLVSPNQRIYAYRQESGTPFFKPVAYSASKSALFNLTRYLATYWGDNNVRVNTLTFGGVFNHQDDQFLQGYCERVPIGRMAYEDEYNGAILYLISDASSYMTGANMVIDGGWTAW